MDDSSWSVARRLSIGDPALQAGSLARPDPAAALSRLKVEKNLRDDFQLFRGRPLERSEGGGSRGERGTQGVGVRPSPAL